MRYTWREQKQHGYLLLILPQDTDDRLRLGTDGVYVTAKKYLYNHRAYLDIVLTKDKMQQNQKSQTLLVPTLR